MSDSPKSPTISASSSKSQIDKEGQPCRFFLSGNCRNGSNCQFSHDPNLLFKTNDPNASTHPPPIIINVPQGHPVYGIDVECVASGISHNARSVAQVALVDAWSRPVFNVYVKQDKPVASYITPLTGLTKEILDEYGVDLGIYELLFV